MALGFPKTPSRQVDRDVFRRLWLARFLEAEAGAEVGMASRRRCWIVVTPKEEIGSVAAAGAAVTASARAQTPSNGASFAVMPQLPVPPCESHLFLLLLLVRRWRCFMWRASFSYVAFAVLWLLLGRRLGVAAGSLEGREHFSGRRDGAGAVALVGGLAWLGHGG